MEISTCEQYVLNELEAERAENERLREKIKELEIAAAERDAKIGESPNGEIEPRQVQMVRMNESFETAYLTVRGVYDLSNKKYGLGITADEARAKAATRDGLLDVAKQYVGGYTSGRVMDVRTDLWPCQIRTGSQTFVFDVYNGGKDIRQVRVHKDDEEASAGYYYPSYRADELFELGLEMLKKNLLEYADKLDAEAEKEANDE